VRSASGLIAVMVVSRLRTIHYSRFTIHDSLFTIHSPLIPLPFQGDNEVEMKFLLAIMEIFYFSGNLLDDFFFFGSLNARWIVTDDFG
jgi:hypothetical protein